MQPSLKEVRQLLAHMGLGLAARHDPEPGPFLRNFLSGRYRRHQYATTDGIITHPASKPVSHPARPAMARPPGETSPPVPLLSIWMECGETAQRQRFALEELRG